MIKISRGERMRMKKKKKMKILQKMGLLQEKIRSRSCHICQRSPLSLVYIMYRASHACLGRSRASWKPRSKRWSLKLQKDEIGLIITLFYTLECIQGEQTLIAPILILSPLGQ